MDKPELENLTPQHDLSIPGGKVVDRNFISLYDPNSVEMNTF